MHVETRLIILHIDFDTGAQQCLFDNHCLPFRRIDSEHPQTVCPKILEEFLEVDPSWVTFTLVDVTYDDTLAIYYTCLIPAVLENHRGEWTDIGDIDNEDIQKIIFEAGQKSIARL